MKKPKMILFDYGQTLCTENWDTPLGGAQAVLAHSENPNRVTAEEYEAFAQQAGCELGLIGSDPWSERPELCHHAVSRYVMDSLGLSSPLLRQELEELYWYGCSSPASATEHMNELLRFLRQEGVRTGVISNLCYNERTLQKRLQDCLPGHAFEFVLVSSEYAFRKPHRRIFELALQKAGLPAGEVWFCGDSASCDVDGSAWAGMQAVWYTGAMLNPESRSIRPRSEGYLTVAHWRELEELLRRL